MIALLSLLALHFIGDFICQTDEMATQKSKDWAWLTIHVVVYTWVLAAGTSIAFISTGWGPAPWLAFVGLTFALHFVQDAITSRITSKLWFFEHKPGLWARTDDVYHLHVVTGENGVWLPVEGRRHWFFVMIGLDQLLHACALAFTWWLVTR